MSLDRFFGTTRQELLYRRLLLLAKIYYPAWADSFSSEQPEKFPNQDPGLTLLKLSSPLLADLFGRVNQIPERNRDLFYQFLDYREPFPEPAKAHCIFDLVEGTFKQLLPIGTTIASQNNSELVFCTTHDLQILPLKVERLFWVNPELDLYSDKTSSVQSEEAFSLFDEASGQAIPHQLFLSNSLILFFSTAPKNFEVTIRGSGLRPSYFIQWADAVQRYLSAEILEQSFTSLKIKLSGFQAIPKTAVGGVTSYWISVSPESQLQINGNRPLPLVTSIEGSIESQDLSADFAIYNSSPIDIDSNFYPFGETPALYDCFYLASEEAFSKSGASIELVIDVIPPSHETVVVLTWEYWDGVDWKELAVVDGTQSLTFSGTLSFLNPTMEKLEVSGTSTYWIRARITSGGYGSAGQYIIAEPISTVINELDQLPDVYKPSVINELQQEGINFGYKFDPPSYAPPSIKRLAICYQLSGSLLENAFDYNSFDYQYFFAGSLPYQPCSEPLCVLIGLGPESSSSLADSTFSLYVAMRHKYFVAPDRSINEVTWSFYNGQGWSPLIVEDGTSCFQQAGVVRFKLPFEARASVLIQSDSPILTESTEEDAEIDSPIPTACYWIRAEFLKPTVIQLRGIYPNGCEVANQARVEQEIIGSSNGTIDQSFGTAYRPILPKGKLEVLEPFVTAPESLWSDEKPNANDAESDGIWVPWEEVNSFILSSSMSRHFQVDSVSGVIQFGNGLQGMIPPIGADNLRFSYDWGGGEQGQVDADELTVLVQPDLGIGSVRNPMASFGGTDVPSRVKLNEQWASQVSSGNRAVTCQDFATLACQTSPRVVRAKCLDNKIDEIQVYVLIFYSPDEPELSSSLYQSIQQTLQAKALFSIQNRIQVRGPEFLKIRVILRIKARLESDARKLTQDIKLFIAHYFNPFTGNDDGLGWDFGESIYLDLLARSMEQAKLEGLQYVESVVINGKSRDVITLSANALPKLIDTEVQLD